MANVSIMWDTDGKRYLFYGNRKLCIGNIRIVKDVKGRGGEDDGRGKQ